MTQKELTEFVEEAILVVKKKLSEGYLTEPEYHDYVRLFYFAVDKVLHRHPHLREGVHQMTEPLIKLPSVIMREMQAEITAQKSELETQKSQLAEQEAEIRRLQQLVDQLSSENHAL